MDLKCWSVIAVQGKPRPRGRVLAALLGLGLLLAAPLAWSQGACSGRIVDAGEGTYYGYTPATGNCSFTDDASPLVAAMNATDYAASKMCGQCVRVTGPNGSVDVRIVDQCPECANGDIDLNQAAFERIANLAAGRVPITWRTIPCPVTGSQSFYVQPGGSSFFANLQVRDHRYGIAKVEYLTPTGYVTLPRQTFNYFTIAGPQVPVPIPATYSVRVTDVNGSVLVQNGLTVNPGVTQPGSGQFPLCADDLPVASVPALGPAALAVLAVLLVAIGIARRAR